jgi:hypothetical protein
MAYVYRHIRLDKNEPFYIGIGSDNVYKRANDKKGRNKIWYDIAAKTDYEIEILFDNISWDDACKKEIEFISLYGKKVDGGILSNITDGGEGTLGLKHKEETKQRLSKIFKGCKHTKDAIKKIKETSKRPCSDEKKKKLSIANKGHKMTEEQIEKMKIASTGRKLSESAKEKLRIANTGIKRSDETREKIRSVVREIWRKRKENIA